MDIDALTADDRKQLAKDLAAELDTGLYGNRAVLSRRQLFTLAGGSAGVAGLVALGVDPATAQSAAGQVGTPSSPETVYAYDLDVQNGAEFNGNDLTGVGSLSTEEETIGIPNPSGNSTGDNIPELANRRVAPELTIQPRGGDEVGSATVYPSGTEDRSHFLVANSSDVSNYGGVKWEISDTVADIEGFYKGSGTEPDRLRIKDFPIGIPLINTGGLRPEQGTPTDPSNLFLSVESDNTATGIQTTATDITADNTSQPLYEATDPPFIGLHIITGQYNVGDNTFCDLVIQIRNSTVTPVQKEVGTGSVGPRNYSLDGATFEVAIDETTSNVYNLTDTFIGGGT